MYSERLKSVVRKYLGTSGVRFFQLVHSFHGTVRPVLRLNRARKGIPMHSIHFREGMQIRNFLRKQKECSNWTPEDFDNHWADVVTDAIGREVKLPIGYRHDSFKDAALYGSHEHPRPQHHGFVDDSPQAD
jgi:hypothetical protein